MSPQSLDAQLVDDDARGASGSAIKCGQAGTASPSGSAAAAECDQTQDTTPPSVKEAKVHLPSLIINHPPPPHPTTLAHPLWGALIGPCAIVANHSSPAHEKILVAQLCTSTTLGQAGKLKRAERVEVGGRARRGTGRISASGGGQARRSAGHGAVAKGRRADQAVRIYSRPLIHAPLAAL